MPLEIRELVIKVNVNQSGEAASGREGAPSQAGRHQAAQQANKKAIVAECVEQVLDILKKKDER